MAKNYMRFILLTLFGLSGLLVEGQKINDYGYSGCFDQKKSVYQELGRGNHLLIASYPADCQDCEAALRSFKSGVHAAQISIWRALVPAKGQNDPCSEFGSTKKKNADFIFIDHEGNWLNDNKIGLHLISASDSSRVYAGASIEGLKAAVRNLDKVNAQSKGIQLTSTNVDVFPNPFREELSLKVSSIGTEGLQFRLFNLIGKELIAKNLGEADSYSTVDIDLRDLNLEEGYYFVRLEQGEQIETRRFLRE